VEFSGIALPLSWHTADLPYTTIRRWPLIFGRKFRFQPHLCANRLLADASWQPIPPDRVCTDRPLPCSHLRTESVVETSVRRCPIKHSHRPSLPRTAISLTIRRAHPGLYIDQGLVHPACCGIGKQNRKCLESYRTPSSFLLCCFRRVEIPKGESRCCSSLLFFCCCSAAVAATTGIPDGGHAGASG
jgi:hypothetical protein